jgi:hypothetical protein
VLGASDRLLLKVESGSVGAGGAVTLTAAGTSTGA